MSYEKIDFEQAKTVMDSSENYILLDVRTAEEYAVEHAEGAVLFPLDSINAQTADSIIPDKNTTLLLYCRTGRRSLLAAEELQGLGYSNIRDLGSLAGWPYGKEYGV